MSRPNSKASEGRYKVEDKTYDDLEEAKIIADMTDNPVLDSQENDRPIYDGGNYRTESKASEFTSDSHLSNIWNSMDANQKSDVLEYFEDSDEFVGDNVNNDFYSIVRKLGIASDKFKEDIEEFDYLINESKASENEFDDMSYLELRDHILTMQNKNPSSPWYEDGYLMTRAKNLLSSKRYLETENESKASEYEVHNYSVLIKGKPDIFIRGNLASDVKIEDDGENTRVIFDGMVDGGKQHLQSLGYDVIEESKASEYSIKEEFDLQDQDGKYEMLSKADLSVTDATNYSTYSHDELPEEVKDSLKGDEDSFGESWSQKSSINRIEALERIGVKQGDAIKLSSLEFEDFGEDLQGALKGDVEDARREMKSDKDTLDKTDPLEPSYSFQWQQGGEVENPNSEFDQSYPDYNNIGESQTNMTSYECELCDSGFKSNEALSVHHNDKHAIAPESLDGYATEIGMHGGDGASFYDGKTFTCDKCGKVGNSFSDMAQEECPADVNANHQIPIFGDMKKESYAHEDDMDTLMWDNENPDDKGKQWKDKKGKKEESKASELYDYDDSMIDKPIWDNIEQYWDKKYNECELCSWKAPWANMEDKYAQDYPESWDQEIVIEDHLKREHRIVDKTSPHYHGESKASEGRLSHYTDYFDQAYSDRNDENPITGYRQCDYCDSQFRDYDDKGMIDHANSRHNADLDPNTGETPNRTFPSWDLSRESKASEGYVVFDKNDVTIERHDEEWEAKVQADSIGGYVQKEETSGGDLGGIIYDARESKANEGDTTDRFEADIENDQVIQKLPTDKRSFDAEAGAEDHVCAECGFTTSDNSEYIDHLNSHEV